MSSPLLLVKLVKDLAFPRASHPTPPNQSNSIPPSQSNPTLSSSGHPTKPRELRDSTLPISVRVSQSPSHPTGSEQDTNLTSQSPSHLPPPRQNILNHLKSHALNIFESLGHSLPPPSSPPTPHGQRPDQFHTMDRLSLCVLNYFFAFGVSYTSLSVQRPNLSTSILIQCFIMQAAFSLFLLANVVFHRTRPDLAFYLDRLSFFLVVISAYLASMPMFPPYFAIIMLLVVIIVHIVDSSFISCSRSQT